MTKQISSEKLRNILNLYKPDCRYLIKAATEYPRAEGKFRLRNTYHTTKKLEHMTSIEAQLCLNQLCYSAFSEWLVTQRKFNEDITFEEYIKLMNENMVIADSRIMFKKPIPTGRDIQGTIEITRIRKHSSLYLALLNFDLEQGKSKGKLELVYKK